MVQYRVTPVIPVPKDYYNTPPRFFKYFVVFYTFTGVARFVREWRGEPHEVTVLGLRAFEYRGEILKSLTAIAERITGTPRVVERVIASQEIPPGLNASRARKSVPLLWKEQLREFLGE
jgi:hypothetical protein